jgi:hypothetical protein
MVRAPCGVVGVTLAARHAIDAVVSADHRHIDVAARSVDQVIAADGDNIAIAADDHHFEVGV